MMSPPILAGNVATAYLGPSRRRTPRPKRAEGFRFVTVVTD